MNTLSLDYIVLKSLLRTKKKEIDEVFTAIFSSFVSGDKAFGLFFGGKRVEDLIQSRVTLLLWREGREGGREGRRE